MKKQSKSNRVLVTIAFVAETGRMLMTKQRYNEFHVLADRALEFLQGNPLLKKLLLLHFVNFDNGLPNDTCMLKYYFAAEKLFGDSAADKKARIDILLKIADAYFFTAHYQKTLEYTFKAKNIAHELQDKAGEASCCTNVGNAYLGLGEYKKAIEYFLEKLELSNELGDLAEIASSNGSLGNVFCNLGDYEKAIVYYKKGLDISIEIGDQSGVANHYSNLGGVYGSLADYDNAMEYCKKGLEISIAIGDRSGLALKTCNLGSAYHSLGEYRKAIHYYQEGLLISTEIGDQSGIANNNSNLASAYSNLGEYEKAIDYSLKGLKVSNDIGYKAGIAKSNRQWGSIYLDLGEYDKAICYYEKALGLSTEIGEKLEIARNISKLGNAYRNLGKYEMAIYYCQKGLMISTAIGDQSGIASNHCNIGNAYFCLGNYEIAVYYYEKALEISTTIGYRTGMASNNSNLGSAHLSLGEYQKAIGHFEKGLEISTELGDQSRIASNNRSLGSSYLNLGEYAKAIDYYEKGLEISTSIGDRAGVAGAYCNLGNTFLGLKDYEKAKEFYYQGFNVSLEIGEPILEGSCLEGSGNTYLSEGHSKIGKPEAIGLFEQASSYLKRSVICRDKVFSNLNVDKNKITFTKGYFLRYVTLMHCFISLQRPDAALLVIDLGKAKALHAFIEKQKKSEGEDMVSYTRQTWDRIDNKQEKIQIDEIKKVLELKSGDSCVLLFAFDRERFLNIWVANNDDEIRTVTVRKPLQTFFSLVQKLLRNVNVSLDQDSSFHRFDSNRNPDEQIVFTPFEMDRGPPTSDDVIPQVENEPQEILRTLFELLMNSVKDFLKGTKLIIVPDEHLFFVPFCSLLDENRCPVSESYSVQITPSLHTLISRVARTRDVNVGFALFVGNPTVGKVRFRGSQLVPGALPNATEEVKSLSKHFDAKPVVEGQATKERVLSLIQGACIIHIAAHGEPVHGEIFLAPNTAMPEIALSSLPDEKSYLLSQRDIMKISVNARLVVLCCCHTGQGDTSSEGVVGITRAFLAAGARSVLATLWPIHDKVTKQFMGFFYENICQGISVCEALRQTMNMFLKHENEEFRSFTIWAPFTIYGEDVHFTQEEMNEIKRKSAVKFEMPIESSD